MDMRSARKDGTGTLKLALSHKHQTVYESLGIKIKKDEWDPAKLAVISREDKKFCNIVLRKRFAEAELALQRIQLRRDFESLTAREILTMIVRGTDTADTPEDADYLLPVYNEYITLCRKATTAQLFKTSLNNLIEYESDIDSLRFKDINVAWLRKYQQWLLDTKGMEVNGANVYLRNLRTIFNYALENEMTAAHYPFKSIDMTPTEPDTPAIPYETFLEWATAPTDRGRSYYRDFFMLSFYLCGIRPVDLLNVKKNQVKDGRLVYWPTKLGGKTKMSIKIEPEAWEIIKMYEGEEYLINVMEKRTDYKEFCKHWNKALRAIGTDVKIPKVGKKGKRYYVVEHHGIVPFITSYYPRRCWATYAYNVLDIPMDVISQALGHKSGLKVTNFYVKRDGNKADQANRKLIDRVTADMRKKLEGELITQPA